MNVQGLAVPGSWCEPVRVSGLRGPGATPDAGNNVLIVPAALAWSAEMEAAEPPVIAGNGAVLQLTRRRNNSHLLLESPVSLAPPSGGTS